MGDSSDQPSRSELEQRLTSARQRYELAQKAKVEAEKNLAAARAAGEPADQTAVDLVIDAWKQAYTDFMDAFTALNPPSGGLGQASEPVGPDNSTDARIDGGGPPPTPPEHSIVSDLTGPSSAAPPGEVDFQLPTTPTTGMTVRLDDDSEVDFTPPAGAPGVFMSTVGTGASAEEIFRQGAEEPGLELPPEGELGFPVGPGPSAEGDGGDGDAGDEVGDETEDQEAEDEGAGQSGQAGPMASGQGRGPDTGRNDVLYPGDTTTTDSSPKPKPDPFDEVLFPGDVTAPTVAVADFERRVDIRVRRGRCPARSLGLAGPDRCAVRQFRRGRVSATDNSDKRDDDQARRRLRGGVQSTNWSAWCVHFDRGHGRQRRRSLSAGCRGTWG